MRKSTELTDAVARVLLTRLRDDRLVAEELACGTRREIRQWVTQAIDENEDVIAILLGAVDRAYVVRAVVEQLMRLRASLDC